MESIDSTLSPDLLPLVNQSRDKGASSWLNAMPPADQGLSLNKQEFRDSLRLRYNLSLVDLPSLHVRGDKFNVGDAHSYKKGGFVAQRHDGVRNLLTAFVNKVCNNVEIEPRLQPLDNERLHLRSAVTSSETRLDIKALAFWSRGVTAFFYVRFRHVNSKCYQYKTISEVSKEQEDERKRNYQQRVLDADMASFTPLVFGTNGGMGNESQCSLKHLADKIAQKDTEPDNTVIAWLSTQISFELLRSVHACVRGSRTPFHSKIEHSLDCKKNVATARI